MGITFTDAGLKSAIALSGKTAATTEKRAVFYKRLVRLVDFERELNGVDLSKVVLTRHRLKNQGKQNLGLNEGEGEQLKPITEAGAGKLREKEKVYMAALVEKLNDLFGQETTDLDQPVYVNGVGHGQAAGIRHPQETGGEQFQ